MIVLLLPCRFWTDDSLVLDQLTGVSYSGSGFFAHQAEHFWNGRRWGHVDGVRFDLILRPAEVFVLFLGLFRLFKELKCGESFWPCRPLLPFTLV